MSDTPVCGDPQHRHDGPCEVYAAWHAGRVSPPVYPETEILTAEQFERDLWSLDGPVDRMWRISKHDAALRREVEVLRAELTEATLTQLDALYPPELLARAEAAEARVAELTEALRDARREHLWVEDCWYSCPKSIEGCCNESQGDTCNCGADAWNARIDALLSHPEQTDG